MFEPDRVVSLTSAQRAKQQFVQQQDELNIWRKQLSSFLLDLRSPAARKDEKKEADGPSSLDQSVSLCFSVSTSELFGFIDLSSVF